MTLAQELSHRGIPYGIRKNGDVFALIDGAQYFAPFDMRAIAALRLEDQRKWEERQRLLDDAPRSITKLPLEVERWVP